MINSILALLALAGTLLVGIGQNPHASDAAKTQVVGVAGRAVQLATQAVAVTNIPEIENSNIWPNYDQLQSSLYLDVYGARVPPEGQGVQLLGEYTSFGDLNNDGLDDAAVVVRRLFQDGTPSLALAVMLNQGKILFNIADIPLEADSITVYDHHIVSGELVIDMQIGSGTRKIYRYKLLGNTLVKV